MADGDWRTAYRRYPHGYPHPVLLLPTTVGGVPVPVCSLPLGCGKVTFGRQRGTAEGQSDHTFACDDIDAAAADGLARLGLSRRHLSLERVGDEVLLSNVSESESPVIITRNAKTTRVLYRGSAEPVLVGDFITVGLLDGGYLTGIPAPQAAPPPLMAQHTVVPAPATPSLPERATVQTAAAEEPREPASTPGTATASLPAASAPANAAAHTLAAPEGGASSGGRARPEANVADARRDERPASTVAAATAPAGGTSGATTAAATDTAHDTSGRPTADCSVDDIVALVTAGETMYQVQKWNKKLRDTIRRALASADAKEEHAESAAESNEIHKTLTAAIKKATTDRTRIPFLREQRAGKEAQAATRKRDTAVKQAEAKGARGTVTRHTPRGSGKARIGDSAQASANAQAGKDTRKQSPCRFWRTGIKGGHGLGCSKEDACPYAHNLEWAARVKAKCAADLAAAAVKKGGGKRKREMPQGSAVANSNKTPTQPRFQTAHQQGCVVRSEVDRGFYIIAADGNRDQIFCHTRNLVGVDQLAVDDRVRFQLTKSAARKDGYEAINVTVTGSKRRAVSVRVNPGPNRGQQGGKGR